MMIALIEEDEALAVPAGFKRVNFTGTAFNVLIGPIYFRRGAEDDMRLGFRVQQGHCNPAGMLHGGMMMTMADMTAGFVTAFKAGIDKFLPTINMTFDFVSPGKAGQWIDCSGEVVKVTRHMAFATVALHCGTEQLLRGSCIMKIPSGDAFRFDRSRFL
jgi:uncharacterized protein (TIGR00369 family)